MKTSPASQLEAISSSLNTGIPFKAVVMDMYVTFLQTAEEISLSASAFTPASAFYPSNHTELLLLKYIYIHRYLLTKRQLIGIEMNMQFRTLTIVIDRLAASEREIQMETLKIKQRLEVSLSNVNVIL